MRRWFSRTGLQLESEAITVQTRTGADFTHNGKPIISTGELTRTTKAAAITLDGGATVTTMTRRGVATPAASYTVEEGNLTIVIPAFVVTAVTAGTISVVTLGQTAIKPKADTVFSVPLLTGSGPVTGKLEWYAATGNFALSKIDGSAITVNFGPYFDIIISIN